MATPLRAKRMARERQELEQENPDFFVLFKNDNLFDFKAYVIGPHESLYRHKLIKLHIPIPVNYPISPPEVKFIQHRGERVHPNLYVEGKVCLSILGTWPGEPWAFGMTISGVLITVRSLLDNKPYMHEPDQSDSPGFNQFVESNSWRWLLLDYLDNEAEPEARSWLQRYVSQHAEGMVSDLSVQTSMAPKKPRPYNPYKRSQHLQLDYSAAMKDLQTAIISCRKIIAESSLASQGNTTSVPKKRKEPGYSGTGSPRTTIDTVLDSSAKSQTKRIKAGEVVDLSG